MVDWGKYMSKKRRNPKEGLNLTPAEKQEWAEIEMARQNWNAKVQNRVEQKGKEGGKEGSGGLLVLVGIVGVVIALLVWSSKQK